MLESKIGKLTCKPPTLKEGLGGRPKRIIGGVSTKNLPTYSTLHLLLCNSELISELMITEGNIHADQSAQRTMKISFIRWFLLLMCLDSIIPYSKPKGGNYHGDYHREGLWSGCA